ncbi:MAG: PD-(D/E)XK nuclease family protein [Eubacteriales bacterium]|nr:PD-(D/E)XK nuclease family protein [Eubacteriales bacterium]
MLTILSGRAGSLWQPVAREIAKAYHQSGEVVLLVPEQYTLTAEKDVLDALKVPGFFRLHVLSPSRFLSRVADRLGQGEGARIDERGKLMTVARGARRMKGDLEYYASVTNRPGFAGQVTEAITELKGAGITPEQLAAAPGAEEPGKLRDLAVIYAEYERLLAGKSADSEDIQREALARFAASGLFSGASFFVYGFDLLSQPLIRLITAWAARAGRVLLALVRERPAAPDGDAFSPVNRSVSHLTAALTDAGLRWEAAWHTDGPHRPDDLAHLERHFLRIRRTPFARPPEHISLYAARSPHAEVRWVAQRVLSAMRSGMAPEDIVVVLANPQEYGRMLPGVFRDYRIPHYLAEKEPILGHSLVRCLLSALECIKLSAWQQEDVFGYIKSPFSPLTAQEAWALENYALAFGIYASRWTKPFSRGEEAEAMEALRLKALAPVMRLRERLAKARSAATSLRGVIAFLEEIDAYQQMVALEQTLLAQGMPEEAVRTRQVWDKLCGLFEQMAELLGEERVPMNQFPALLSAGLSQTELSALPPQEHCVLIGGLGQLMPGRPKMVFVLGLNSGVMSHTAEPLVTDAERHALEETFQVHMDLPQDEKDAVSQLDLWKALAAAGEHLCLSYALSDEAGKALAPLSHLSRIRGLFPGLMEEGGALGSLRETEPAAPIPAIDELAGLLGEGDVPPIWQDAWAWLSQDSALGPLTRSVTAAAQGDSPRKKLPREEASELFSAETVSVSRLETYAECPFKHFVTYGLKPHERLVWAVQPADYGSFCHQAMEGFGRRAITMPGWPDVTREQVRAAMDAAMANLTENWDQTPFSDTARSRHTSGSYLSVCRNMAQVMTEAAQASSFEPAGFELRFGMGGGMPPVELQLEDGSTLRLKGVIDRADMAEHEGQEYLRVIDYKTGRNSLDAAEVQAGSQLALLLYLYAARGQGGDIKPAGAFYQLLDDPLVRADSADKARKEAIRRLRLSGVLLKDSAVIRLMDAADPPYSLMKLTKNDGMVMDKDFLLSPEGMDRLIRLAADTARDLSGRIASGVIDRSPLINSHRRAACAYCRFQGICRLDSLHTERAKRMLGKVTFKELVGE